MSRNESVNGTYLHAPGLVNREASRAELAATNVASDRPWTFLDRRGGGSARRASWTIRFRLRLLSHFLSVLALVAAKVQGDRLLHGFRRLRLRTRRALFQLLLRGLRMAVEPFRLVRFPAAFAWLRCAFRGRGREHLQIVLYRRP